MCGFAYQGLTDGSIVNDDDRSIFLNLIENFNGKVNFKIKLCLYRTRAAGHLGRIPHPTFLRLRGVPSPTKD